MKTKTSLVLRINQFLLLTIASTIALRSAATPTDTNEVWVSARTNALGTLTINGNGAITNPFYGDFDAIMRSLSTNTTIHLLPGVHYTMGFYYGFDLAAYQRVLGAGIDTTTIRRDTNFHYNGIQMEGVLHSTADGVEVRDLTIDANANGAETYKQCAIGLLGNYCKIHRVRAINTSGNMSSGQECFAVYVGGTNPIVSETEVSSVRGNYCTAISLGLSVGGVVRHCSVFFPLSANSLLPNSIFQAYQANGTHDALFHDNISIGGGDGFYTDTFAETNLMIANNSFKNVQVGIAFTKSSFNMDGLTIRNNLIELGTNSSTGISVYNENTNGNISYRNVNIIGNTVTLLPGAPSGRIPIYVASSIGSNIIGVKIQGNTVDRNGMVDSVMNAQNIWLADNMDTNGVPLHVREVGPGSASSVALNKIDGSVFVTATNTTAITLPTAWGFSGKEVSIANKKTSGTITINPPSGQAIMPTSSLVLTPSESARFLSDGTSVWSRLFTTNLFVGIAATNGTGCYTFTHGLGITPCWIRVVFQCVSPDDATGFVAGDEVDAISVVDQSVTPYTLPSVYVSSDSSTITISSSFYYGHEDALAFILKGSPPPNFLATDSFSKWRLKVYAKSNLQ